MEAALELSFMCILQIDFMNRLFHAQGFFEVLDYLITLLVMVSLVGLPIFIVTFYCKNFDRLGEDEFEKKWGAIYEGLEVYSE